ncbi:MAG: hypothetical protein D3910_09260 [Candidatus Electrothrix sp. ATG2]|nr:hypothetical protein [Candidatus Electrothrix sp. ATG2]
MKIEIAKEDVKTERECGKLLEEIAWVLLSAAEGTATFVKSEQYVTAGRVDIIVLADLVQMGGSLRREAYVWELKAPQLEIFEVKTQSLAQPSSHLYGAETQLMHYYQSIINDSILLRRLEILSPEHVKFGGVIIGRDDNFVKNKLKNLDETTGERLAHEANEIRDKYVYRQLNMNLWTWDNVLYLAQAKQLSNQRIEGDPSTTIDLQSKAELTTKTTEVSWDIEEK